MSPGAVAASDTQAGHEGPNHLLAERKHWLAAAFAALRVSQWVKNLLVFVPLVMAHEIQNGTRLFAACATFAVFSLLASGIYIVNDLFDVESDRQHPRKKHRPLAAGDLSVPSALGIAASLLAAALAIATLTLPAPAMATIVFYACVAFSYSYRLKQFVVSDVLVLASLYVVRVIAGGLAVQVALSHWLLGFSMFVFLSLALMKRYTELDVLERHGRGNAPGRGYVARDREWVGPMGIASGYMSVVVLALYITSEDVKVLYRWPSVLWPVCVAVLFWITRLWALAYRGSVTDDPVIVTLKDRVSYVVGAVTVLLLFIAAWM